MAELSESQKLCTFKEVKDFLMGTLDRSKPGQGKVPFGAQQNVWMCFMPPPSDTYNEVYPNIFVGDGKMGQDPNALKKAGVTHIVNCAMGKKFSQVDTNEEFFAESGIKFHGFISTDILTCKIAPHFDAAVDFIDHALKEGGKVYVHCVSGVSRSATIVLAFLMTKRDMPLMEAVKVVRDKRKILPNDGFLRQLIDLNNKLYGATVDSKTNS